MGIFGPKKLPHVLIYEGSDDDRRFQVKRILKDTYGNHLDGTCLRSMSFCKSFGERVKFDVVFSNFHTEIDPNLLPYSYFSLAIKSVVKAAIKRKGKIPDLPYYFVVIHDLHKIDSFDQASILKSMELVTNDSSIRFIFSSDYSSCVAKDIINRCVLIQLNHSLSILSADSTIVDRCFINYLSDELLFIIFNYLNDLKDWQNCELVCRRWKHVMTLVWSSKKNLPVSSRISKEILGLVLEKCSNLKTLDLRPNPIYPGKNHLFLVGKFCPNIEMLHIPFTYLDPSSLIFMAQQCPKLKYLNLAGTLISDDCLEDLIEVAKNLRGINLSYNNDLSVECFERFKNLEEFEFDKFNLNCLLAIAKNCKNSIRKLTIECENDLNLGDLLIFENLTHLTLTAEDFTPANTADWIFLTSNLKNLKKLSVSTQRDLIIDDVLITIMKNNDSLETLQFEESLLTDKSVSKAPLFCKNLSWLSIRSSQHITDESLKALTSLKKLTHLCIERSKISDEGVFMILRAFPMLGRLNVASCSQVTTKVVEFAYDLMQANRLNRDIVIDCKVGIIKLNRYPSKEVLRSVCNPEDHKCDNKNCLTSSFKFCFEENKDPCTIG